MSYWTLKLGSIVTILLVLVGSYGYASTHVKNPHAPLQPPVEKSPAAVPVVASPTPIPSLVGTRRGNPPRATSTAEPHLNLQPGVQATDLPTVSFTHVS